MKGQVGEVYEEGEHEKTPEELAGDLARTLWTVFLKDYKGHITLGDRNLIENDLEATIDHDIALVKEKKGLAMAEMVADRLIDEVEHCSIFVIESVKRYTKEAKEKYLHEEKSA